MLGFVNDAFFRWVADVGVTGMDQGRGGRYLFLPPGYDGPVPERGFHVVPTDTNMHWVLARAFVTDGGLEEAVAGVKAGMKVYLLSEAASPPEETFVDLSGRQMSTIHANDVTFYEELAAVVQNEPADALPKELTGLFASIGIKKDQPFAPDERMKNILVDAAAVGNATARAISFRPRNRDKVYFYPDREWYSGFTGGNHEFMDNGELVLDDRTLFHYFATGITPAMAAPQVGSGSVYAFTAQDADGAYLNGSKTYKVELPAPVPAKDFWSFTVYSTQHRSMLETDQKLAGLESTLDTVAANKDGSFTVWVLVLLFSVALAGCGGVDTGSALSSGAPEPVAEVPEIKPGLLQGYLSDEDQLDSNEFVLPAPQMTSALQSLDTAWSEQMVKLRGSPRWEVAISDADLAFPAAADTFACSLGFSVTEEDTPALYMLLRRTLTDIGLATYPAKTSYQRQRPFMINGAAICTPEDEEALREDGSYPSGHTAVGWGWALILSELAPDRGEQILARGRAFGESRTVCNVHWYSDVVAGRLVGAAAVARLQSNPAYREALEAARSDLERMRAAGQTPPANCAAEAKALGFAL